MVVTMKNLNPTEDLISDQFWDVFDPIPQPLDISTCHNAIIVAALNNFEFHVKFRESLIPFTLFPLPNCPDFVSLCAECFLYHKGSL